MDRRKQILNKLNNSEHPITGSELAQMMGVSRQVIVRDIAVIRAEGNEILATPQGYVAASPEESTEESNSPLHAQIAVDHPPERTEEELNTFVDSGVRVIDVIVEHSLYGDLTGALMLRSRRDVSRFIERLNEAEATLLSSLTGGVHLHTVEFDRIDDLKRAEKALREKGLLAEKRQ